MRPRLVFGIIGIIGFTSLVMFNFSQSISSYVDFEQASQMNGDRIHVVGIWDDSKPASFSTETMTFNFYMKDESGNSRRVTYPRPKPNNFEQADQIVVIGEMRGDTFVSNDMLVKCPSKYNDAVSPELSELQ
ncbi:cytochrome c maturation protein CcmE [Natronogracilivirga saccharolytica]|uniref:Cytochrome c maturation protein CcmE n=1 Tax=Natronogracilivirga saccharolytica TaxID=2812953 RepID=A0A8J7UVK2_9BACT|nr:cytochrome c maturation protein CcmE [Natronogracilivirga saccharolytica]MBP3192631.1 cytochrome c maturation protein CcmE [Natronogracilivirga saccharolytica]